MATVSSTRTGPHWQHWFRVAVFATVLTCPLSLQAAPDPSAQDAEAAAKRTFKEWVEVLGIPNVSAVPADIQRNTSWFEQAFQRRGFHTRQLPNNGKPMLFAEMPNGKPSNTTILFYAHLDGQPVNPPEWAQESPWKPVLKRKGANGQWEPLPIDDLFGNAIDPEWRLFARSSSDDKAPIIMLLAAIDLLRAKGIDPAVNVKVLLDSEEEVGSPSLDTVIRDNLELLRCNGLVVLDGPIHPSNRPTLVFGNRGIALATLTVYGSKQELHSGHYGNYVANPAMGLAQLLASMKDEKGRVTIAGYYDPIKLEDAARRVMAAVPDDEPALRKRFGIAEAEQVGGNYQEAMQYPSLNIRGLKSADVGSQARTVIPDRATAELDLRTVPETSPEYLFGLLKAHVEKQGYHLVQGQPTEEDRARYPKLASLRLGEGGSSGTAVRTDLSSPIGEWLRRGLKKTHGSDPVEIRMMGGTVPTGAAVGALNVPFTIVPLVNADNSQHSFDENMRLGNYVGGVRTLVGILTEPFAKP
jgi:acetylornithine deacetylase/succinyl-diaminopimelate desuccinylase-like protein